MSARRTPSSPVTVFGPDFPFAYDDWLTHPAGLGNLPPAAHGQEVAIVGAGMAGMVAAYELMRLGLKPVVYEASRMGAACGPRPCGRARHRGGAGRHAVSASSTAFFHYVNLLGLKTRPFPNPLTPAAGSTVIDIEGQTHYARSLADLPPLFHEVANAWAQALEADARFSDLQAALRERNVPRLKAIWDALVPFGTTALSTISWPSPTLSPSSPSTTARFSGRWALAPAAGIPTFPTPCWRSCAWCSPDATKPAPDRRRRPAGTHGVCDHAPERPAHWPQGTTLASLHQGAPRRG
ncbi:MAG: NAD(P)-binding protein [Burkholderiaceae bacterium]